MDEILPHLEGKNPTPGGQIKTYQRSASRDHGPADTTGCK